MESNQNINCHFSQNSSNESNCNLAENKIEKNPENPKPKIEVKSENSISQNFKNYKSSEHSSSGLPRKISLGENDIKSGKEESYIFAHCLVKFHLSLILYNILFS